LIFLEDQEINRRFVFLNSIRIAILSALILISIFILIFVETLETILPIIVSLSFAVIFSILNFYLFKVLNYRVAIYLQLFVDIIVITFLVYFSGGIVSPFYFLYILPIIVSSIFLKRRDTLYIATLSFIIFGILSDLLYLKVIPFYFGIYPQQHIPLGSFIYNLLMSFIAFSTVAILSSYYFEKIRTTGEALKNIQENLKDLVLLNNTVMEKMENGFMICDSGGKLISYNEKSKNLLNLNSRSNVFELLLSSADNQKIKSLSHINNRYYFEKRENGVFLGVSVSFIENLYGIDKIFVFIVTDLTERKEIEDALKSKEHLALIGEMAAGIAHEIRNPLASISGSVQFLQKELKLEPEYQNLMEIIIRESGRLSKSIEDFLEFTRVTPLNLSDIDISAVMDEIIELIRLNHQKVKFLKKYIPGNVIRADQKKVKQLVWNLLNNAVKAMNEKGFIEIHIYEEGDCVNLFIKDDGVGIEKGELKRIFTPFYSRFTSGIGLGMSIVKRIIEEHGADIKIKSKKNVGTEVTVCFKKVNPLIETNQNRSVMDV
jgi:two-component system sensor histidine kinase PilS (NtrC family)